MDTKQIAEAVQAFLSKQALDKKLREDIFNNASLFVDHLNLGKLEKAIAKAIKEEEPTAEDVETEKASHYLSDGDISIKEMVAAIRNHPDPTDYIDDVEGVVVWQPLEYRYNCSQFLDLL